MKYKTNAKCGGCTSAILKSLSEFSAPASWEFDLTSPDKTLTYIGEGPEPEASKVIAAIELAGFKASQL